MVEILEDVARNSGSATARVAAVKALHRLQKEDDGDPRQRTFEALEKLARSNRQ
jgi:hypothetical protein